MYGEQRYTVLRVYCIILKAGSVIFLIGGIYLIVQTLMTAATPAPASAPANPSPYAFTPPPNQALINQLNQAATVVYVGVGLALSITSWALANYLEAHMSIEENTREMVELMRIQARRSPDINIPYPYKPKPRGLPRYEDTPLGQYQQRQQRK